MTTVREDVPILLTAALDARSRGCTGALFCRPPDRLRYPAG